MATEMVMRSPAKTEGKAPGRTILRMIDQVERLKLCPITMRLRCTLSTPE